jgi:hypothetical protein
MRVEEKLELASKWLTTLLNIERDPCDSPYKVTIEFHPEKKHWHLKCRNCEGTHETLDGAADALLRYIANFAKVIHASSVESQRCFTSKAQAAATLLDDMARHT